MIKNGGYTMLDLATATYKDVAAAFNANKPILVYDNSQVYYADTCVHDSDNDAYVLTKGGKTITIDSSNNIVSSGDILTIMENIVDSKGNKRFVEDNLTLSEISGITINYNKWSLSGTHLMFVLSGVIANASTFSGIIFNAKLPQYIADKIVPFALSNTVLKGGTTTYADDYTTQVLNFEFNKNASDNVQLYLSSFTATKERKFRIQLDLLIDVDYTE